MGRTGTLSWAITMRKVFVYVFLSLGAFVSLVPFAWMIATSLKAWVRR